MIVYHRRNVAGRQRPDARRRMHVMAALMLLCALGLLGRAIDVQIVRRGFYTAQGDARFVRSRSIGADRGVIRDRRGLVLAMSTPMASLWADPALLGAPPGRIDELCRLLGIDTGRKQDMLTDLGRRRFVYVARRVDPELGARVMSLSLQGLHVQTEYKRYYPNGRSIAHVVGNTDVDDRGQAGLELMYDAWLRGTPGEERVIVDGGRRAVDVVGRMTSARPGHDLTLSIDSRLQYLAYRDLEAAVTKNQAASGSVVIMDVHTGEILVMTNFPSYNPNTPGLGEVSDRRNRAITDLQEPGSTVKPLTLATALDEGVITPDSTFNTSPGYMKIGGYTIRDVEGNNGILTSTGIITKSSNVGAAMVAAKMDDQYYYTHLRAFGLGSVTGTGFPAEVAGVVPEPERWNASTKSSMAYGYGLSLSAIQLAQAYSALGNDGVRVSPTLIANDTVRRHPVVSAQAARAVVRMMETVITQGGAKAAALPGYRVAGKTGTARANGPGGYREGHYNSLFVGLIPAGSPRYVTVIVIRDPGGRKFFGGQVSAPVYGELMPDVVRLTGVAPD